MKLYTRGYFDGRDCDGGGRGFKLYDFQAPSSLVSWLFGCKFTLEMRFPGDPDKLQTSL